MKQLQTSQVFTSGIAIAPAFVFGPQKLIPSQERITDTEAEMRRFDAALEEAKADLEPLASRNEIFAAHCELIQDPSLVENVYMLITEQNKNAELALQETMDMIYELFMQMDDSYMRARGSDTRDVGNRIMRKLKGVQDTTLTSIREKVIIIARDLMPSDTAQLDMNYIEGFITQEGGITSHVAIMARSQGIPALIGVKEIMDAVKPGDMIAFDALRGEVFINPDQETLDALQPRMEEYNREKEALAKIAGLPSVSLDGKHLKLYANVGNLQDIYNAEKHGMDGVGLFRTEFLFMNSEGLPTEEEQFEVYKEAAQVLGERELIVRTLDIGGDKALPILGFEAEENPFLGYRAIRMCLDRPDIFRVQLRALLRASVYGNLKIMYPMLVSMDELDRSNAMLESCKDELRLAGVPFNENIEVGMMIETPASVIMAERFAKRVSFFSIGTNDLTQYVLAADRGNGKVAKIYNSFDPAVIHAIDMVIRAAHKEGICVGMCGEFASNPHAFEFLFGLGLDEFSMSAPAVATIKAMLRKSNFEECQKVAQQFLDCDSLTQTGELIATRMQ